MDNFDHYNRSQYRILCLSNYFQRISKTIAFRFPVKYLETFGQTDCLTACVTGYCSSLTFFNWQVVCDNSIQIDFKLIKMCTCAYSQNPTSIFLCHLLVEFWLLWKSSKCCYPSIKVDRYCIACPCALTFFVCILLNMLSNHVYTTHTCLYIILNCWQKSDWFYISFPLSFTLRFWRQEMHFLLQLQKWEMQQFIWVN